MQIGWYAFVVLMAAAAAAAPLSPFPLRPNASVTFRISNVFGSHMVLQRDRATVLWGFADPNTTVFASITGRGVTLTLGPSAADSSGTWRVQLPAYSASRSVEDAFSITAYSSSASQTIDDVLFGDVHLCGGQSNMQFTVHSALNGTEEIKNADAFPLIRLFTVGQSSQSDVPLPELNTTEQAWSIASSASVGGGDWTEFSAVCWFTYRDLYTALAFSGDVVPQGLVSSNWGGTPIQHWSSPEAIAKCSSLKNLSDSVLWNAMLHPYTVGPMSFRTAIWYQGESNVGEAAYYACQFPAMIEDWRAKLSGLNTFGFVQIAGWTGYSNTCSVPISRVLLRINLSFRYATGDLRQAQLQPLHLMPNIALSTAIDLVLALPNPHHPLSAANHAS
jgi:sialate O-acetylesterase